MSELFKPIQGQCWKYPIDSTSAVIISIGEREEVMLSWQRGDHMTHVRMSKEAAEATCSALAQKIKNLKPRLDAPLI